MLFRSTGTGDYKFTRINKNMQERLPNVQWQQVPQAGHNVHVEQPSQVTAILNGINN